MKKSLLLNALIVSNYFFAQLLPTDTSTTDNKYREGGLALGYPSAPTFSSNKLLINGNQSITGSLNIAFTQDLNDMDWGIKSSKPFLIANNNYPLISISTSNIPNVYGKFEAAVATGDHYFSEVAKAGDVIARAHTNGSYIISNSRAGNIKFTTRPAFPGDIIEQVRMIITKDGNIGIGTETPDAKLAVNGLIHTKEVKVDLTGWPDYVFEKDYRLPTIHEAEKHIIEKGHLINMPSAKEIEDSGAEIGKLLKRQQEKIEELTLYIIQLKKEIDAIKK